MESRGLLEERDPRISLQHFLAKLIFKTQPSLIAYVFTLQTLASHESADLRIYFEQKKE